MDEWQWAEVGYVRPPIDSPVIIGNAGEVIPYGSRWGSDGPPDETYSVVSHPERFEPIVTVAEALIEYLAEAYDATVHAGPQVPERESMFDFPPGSGPSVRRVVTITPSRSDAPTLTILFTDFPSVEVQAGMFVTQRFPDCGCDACDDEWSGLAEALERMVSAVVKGTFFEGFQGRRLVTRMWYPGGGLAWEGRPAQLPCSAGDRQEMVLGLPA